MNRFEKVQLVRKKNNFAATLRENDIFKLDAHPTCIPYMVLNVTVSDRFGMLLDVKACNRSNHFNNRLCLDPSTKVYVISRG